MQDNSAFLSGPSVDCGERLFVLCIKFTVFPDSVVLPVLEQMRCQRTDGI